MNNHDNKIMKRLILGVFLMTLLSVAGARAQGGQVRLSKQEMTVGEAIAEIEGQTRYKFAFDNTMLDRNMRAKFGRTELAIDDALDQMFAGTGLGYAVKNRLIAIMMTQEETVQQQPQRPGYRSRFGDIYNRSDISTNNALGRRRPIIPKVEIRDTTSVKTDVVRNDEAASYYSRIIPVDTYLDNTLPTYSIKANLLYGAATLTPNLAFEFGVGDRSTIELSGSWNQWNHEGDEESNKKLNHYLIRPEYRYWFCERFTGHFVGADLFFGQYNISEHKIPLLDFKKQNRYEGYTVGGGLVYGYHLPLSRHWGLEFHLGLGVAYLNYKKFDCAHCTLESVRETKTYVGPTRAGISLVFVIK